MTKISVESATERFERFEKNKAIAVPVRATLQQIYDYVAPDRVRFYDAPNQGRILTAKIWDNTALQGVGKWANNIQSILMPPFKRWYSLEPGDIVNKSQSLTEQQKDIFKRELEEITDQLFNNLNQSNIYQIINEAFQDLAVSTGVIAINEQDGPIPFYFTSIPIDQVYFEEGSDGTLTNFWRHLFIKGRLVTERWKKAKLPTSLSTKINSMPDDEVELVEGAIKYGKKYLYYVQDIKTKSDIVEEWRDYPPFIGFRINKRPGDIYGFSVSQALYPTIRTANLMRYYILKSAKFKALPAFLATKSGALNPNTAVIEPGSIIPVNHDFFQNPPIAPLETGGDPQFADMTLKDLQQEIADAYLMNPLGEVQQTPDRSATEMQLRQQNWVRENGTSVGRLANELIRPLLNVCLVILSNHGLIKDVSQSLGGEKIGTDQKYIWINYQSPLIGIQDQEDAQDLLQYFEALAQMFGQNALQIMNIPEIPIYLSDKMNVPTKFVKTPEEIEEVLQKLAQMAQEQSLQQQTLQKLAEQQPVAQQSAQGVPDQQQPQMPPGEL